ncbi:phage tail assembly chaperone [Sedimentitalea todarodis]|uniref:Uncharacterized protein n=1 Tax=Sedimentitalea todarodis TaxID=1631240 RepID=A0ABU3VHU4_9RHOB|nr:hypothetical protein [Sedimentitalea todarodis]MDU9005741.1 hypothetical protein [Sedimentitalea todarodis]
MAGIDRLKRQLVSALQDHIATGRPANLPVGARVIWNAFTALSRSRSYSNMGPNPISYVEIEAWCRLMRMPLQPHHVDIICALDRAWMNPGSTGEAKPQPRSGLTAAVFDAVVG